MRRRAALLAAAMLAVAPAAGGRGEAAPSQEVIAWSAPVLPTPTGAGPVGLRTMELRDTSRRDPWDPARVRESMVSLWYPAQASKAPRAHYVTARESEMILRLHRVEGVPADLLSRTRVHARVAAPPLAAAGSGRPLVLVSPGFALPRSSLTGLAEELASRGYAVAAVDHAYESPAIRHPDGRVTGCLACERDPDGAVVATTRAADLSFVRRRLIRSAGAGGLPRLDPSRVALVGHSMGGAATFEALRTDPGFAVGVNMDGTVHTAGRTRVGKPFMLLGAGEHGRPGVDRTWDRAWEDLSGWRRRFSVFGAGHLSFTDYAPLLERIGRAGKSVTLPAGDGSRITRELIVAFLDERLLNLFGPRLDAVEQHRPEVRRHGG
ncbi:alpha/beta hydrolase family protein [Streptomyces turgidiscabies]|uniref:Dienelactone hydrolase n=1 Tax=Streptomyces turgidiscabies TaxID=85558 RepID=A0ABU0S2Z2_9ACTN|nr:lipase [Streptomyces turgidiscabies]MDQ0937545.1 dienelactone hydrolase [Streptomyces turgidiscabies]